jgi:outer membrane murein-binding lipoprotein Lpp
MTMPFARILKGGTMSKFLVSAALASLFLAGCASVPENDKVASADCKVQPLQPATTTYGRKREVSSLEQREAENQLASSGYRMRLLRGPFGQMGTVEDALRDCDK